MGRPMHHNKPDITHFLLYMGRVGKSQHFPNEQISLVLTCGMIDICAVNGTRAMKTTHQLYAILDVYHMDIKKY